jgi:hypothetical protein
MNEIATGGCPRARGKPDYGDAFCQQVLQEFERGRQEVKKVGKEAE